MKNVQEEQQARRTLIKKQRISTFLILALLLSSCSHHTVFYSQRKLASNAQNSCAIQVVDLYGDQLESFIQKNATQHINDVRSLWVRNISHNSRPQFATISQEKAVLYASLVEDWHEFLRREGVSLVTFESAKNFHEFVSKDSMTALKTIIDWIDSGPFDINKVYTVIANVELGRRNAQLANNLFSNTLRENFDSRFGRGAVQFKFDKHEVASEEEFLQLLNEILIHSKSRFDNLPSQEQLLTSLRNLELEKERLSNELAESELVRSQLKQEVEEASGRLRDLVDQSNVDRKLIEDQRTQIGILQDQINLNERRNRIIRRSIIAAAIVGGLAYTYFTFDGEATTEEIIEENIED